VAIGWCDDINCATTTSTTISTVTDSFGSVCKAAVGADGHAAANSDMMMIWYCPSLAAGGSEQLTVAMSGNAYYLYFGGGEFSAIGGDEQLGAVSTGTTGANAAYPIGTLSGNTRHMNDLVFGNIVTINNSGGCSGSGYMTSLGINGGAVFGYENATAPATYTLGVGCVSGKTYTFDIAAFYPPQPNGNVNIVWGGPSAVPPVPPPSVIPAAQFLGRWHCPPLGVPS
jgi:hypothetical protein